MRSRAMATKEHETSLEHIHSSEYYPKQEMISDDHALQVPFPCLCGEGVRYLGRTADGTIALSNFRIVVCFKDSFINVPLGLIEIIECRDIFFLIIYCKDSRIIRCTFPTNDACLEWYKRLSHSLTTPRELNKVFAFAFYAWCMENEYDQSVVDDLDATCPYQSGENVQNIFDKEVDRMGFELTGPAWRITYANENYKLCPTYPKYHIVPKKILDEDLEEAASFRSSRRLPSIVWRNKKNGAVIARCSQPEVGWLGWRNSVDEYFLQAIATACAANPGVDASHQNSNIPNGHVENGSPPEPQPKKLLIMDARSYTAAVANRAKGGGYECPEYYPNCEIQFMSLANIHAIRKSFFAIRTLCMGGPEQPNWFSLLDNSKWLHHIAGLMKSAVMVVNAIDKDGRPVLVHCSDGWDRTPQIVALAELMLDPYYRTLEGFQVLVEREWCEFGHKFADRCGSGINSDDGNERCPVFLQFLDCVHQLIRQYPCAFEYNEAFLVKLVQHIYSCLFGTFLCNSVREREQANVKGVSFSVWTLLKHDCWKMKNYLYTKHDEVLRPVCNVRNMQLWSAIYLANTSPMTERVQDETDSGMQGIEEEEQKHLEQLPLSKTRSCDNIVAALEHATTLTRTSSDPNLSSELHHDTKYLLQAEVDSTTLDKRMDINLAMEKVAFENAPSSETICQASNGLQNGHGGSESSEVEDKKSEENSATESDGDYENSEGMNGLEEHSESAKSDEGSASDEANDLNMCNGHDATDQTICDISSETDAVQSITSSTDTLTEESSPAGQGSRSKTDSTTDTNDLVSEQSRSNNNISRIQMNGDVMNGLINGDSQELLENRLQEEQDAVYASISTSTTDISDSHVRINLNEKFLFNGQSMRINDFTLSLTSPVVEPAAKISRGTSMDARNGSSKSSTSGSDSDQSTPNISRTPSSTCPPTPSADIKMSEPGFTNRGANLLARRLDVDGLTLQVDPVQVRMHQKEQDYRHRVAKLERQLQAAKIALYQYASGCNGAGKHMNGDSRDEVSSLPDSTGSGELMSLGNCSNAASDLSWEAIEEKDARLTLWVPDHAATHCAGCHNEFWIVRRKHHCRNCGRIFCSTCTDYFIPIPQQQLIDPVRVCRSCFKMIPTLNLETKSDTAAALDMLPAAAAAEA